MAEMRETMIIIGSGIAGMSAGCFGQMNGYKTKIFEMHNVPGGCCTAWRRKEYTFDACIEWMVGTSPGTEMNQIWQEVGALGGKKIKQFEIFNSFESAEGKIVHF